MFCPCGISSSEILRFRIYYALAVALCAARVLQLKAKLFVAPKGRTYHRTSFGYQVGF
ncbi:hypothetical protein [uncultured Helicobacter sp.]|uniref:hypothetical protein n=1 Tax=uncultured Helicobacter sp. TaxID=175537 RepID=UPI00262D7967|nr:hypothetical protein [uncultured Helicobacter sp.]